MHQQTVEIIKREEGIVKREAWMDEPFFYENRLLRNVRPSLEENFMTTLRIKSEERRPSKDEGEEGEQGKPRKRPHKDED